MTSCLTLRRLGDTRRQQRRNSRLTAELAGYERRREKSASNGAAVMSATMESAKDSVRSLVPARMDRLPWTRFHWLIIVGLGVSWILDGLEIQIVAQAGYQDTLHLSNGQVGFVGTVYLIGEVVGALVFGRITDKLGRKKLFMVTLALYLVASAIAGLSFSFWFLLLFP